MKNYLLILVLLFLSYTSFSQIQGVVYDETNSTLPGVTILVKGTDKGTTTDLNGKFSIDAPGDAILVFSFVGYLKQEIPVNNRKKIEVYLSPEVINMDEVVVMGYSNKTKTELSSSVAVLNNKELTDVTTDDIGSMLQGKVTGVQVVSAGGQPGEAAQIRIRGISTIKPGNEEPLYVVDGIIGGSFDPNDVESLTVLKDAGATGMYGARANKGVIIVTTKSGKSGKTQFNFNSSLGYKIADQGHLKMMNGEDFYNVSKELYRDPETHEIDIINFYQFYPRELESRNYDWVGSAFKPAFTQKYYLSASGRKDKFSFYVSGNYFNDKGTFRNTGYEKVNLRLNTKYQFNDRVSMKNKISIFGNRATYHDYMSMYYTYLNLPWDNPFDANGDPVFVDGNTQGWWSRDKINPLHSIDNSEYSSKGTGFDYDLVFDVKITDWLSFNSANRLSFGTDKSHSFISPIVAGTYYGKGFINEMQSMWYGGISTNLFKFNFETGDHTIDGLAGVEVNGGYYEFMSVQGVGLPEGFSVPDVASSELQIGGSNSTEYFRSFISQLNYNFRKKYFLTASYRIDATSNFPPDNRVAHLPSVAASWLMSNESFIRDNISFMNLLKLRVSYGITGDPDIGASRYMGLFSLSSHYNGQPAALPYQLQNYGLTWEKTNELNLGLDVGLFKRVDLTFDIYRNFTENLIILAAQPLSQGFEYRWENAGDVTNKGIELGLSTINVKTATLEWRTGIVFAQNTNTLSGIGTPIYNTVGGVSQIYRDGGEIFTFVLPKWLGVDEQTGAPLWEKINEDGSREATSSYAEATPQEVGNALPDFQGGFNTTLTWKSLSLYANFAYQFGNDVYNSTRRYMDHDGHEPFYNYMEPAPDWVRWTHPGDVATHPSMQNAELSRENSSRFLEDGSFLKLRNISLSYKLPDSWVNAINLQTVVVSLRADNIWTWTKYWGQDPEVNLQKADWAMPGVSDFKYPNNKLFVFNIDVKF
jgi:TonB-linked SusC/RagA family outer membrane protein